MIAYRAILDVPRALAQYLGRLLQAERRERCTPRDSRALTCFQQAVFGLRWFRENRDVPALARDHGISRATGYRYLAEVIDVLADRAPDLHEALRRAKADGATHVVLDGKLFAGDRLGEKTISVKGEQIDAWYSGKTRAPGGNIQAVMAPTGSHCGSPTWNPAQRTISPAPATTSSGPCTGPPLSSICPPWPTTATRAPGSAYTPPSNNPQAGKSSTWTRARTTRCCAACSSSENADSHCSPADGDRYAHHRQPPQNRGHHQSRTRTHPS